MDVAVGYDDGGLVTVALSDDHAPGEPRRLSAVADLATVVDPAAARWIWADTAAIYPRLLAAGVRVDRCHDLRLCHAILAGHQPDLAPDLAPDRRWDRRTPDTDHEPTLLDDQPGEDQPTLEEVVAEYRRQRAALIPDPGDEADRIRCAKLRLLLAAESAGALIAAEMAYHGLPWDSAVHDQQLTELLGPRPRFGGRPAKLQAVVDRLIAALEVGSFNPDSPWSCSRRSIAPAST